MPYRRGDVVPVKFPNSNLRTAKRRPALVVMADGLKSGLPQTVVAMITTTLTRVGPPSRVIVRVNSPAGQQAGLLHDSLVMADNLSTVRDQEIARKLGHFADMSDIDAALRVALGL